MAHFEKQLDSETIFKGRVFTVTKDRVELENGDQSVREIVHHHGGVCVAAITPDNEIYLVRQFRYAFGEELLELPAGKLEAGEDPGEAGRRELSEECGLTAGTFLDLGKFYPTVGYCSEIIHCWLAADLSSTAMHLDEDEFLTPMKVKARQALEWAMDGTIRDGKTVAVLFKLYALWCEGPLKVLLPDLFS